MSKLRFGIIGAGGITAKLHMPELTALSDRAQVTLISGRREARLKVLRDKFPSISGHTTDYNDVIESDAVDAVIIATPHIHHTSWGIKALAAGKHVLMQKPLCGDMASADEFVAAVEKSDRTVFVLPHFMPPIYEFKKRIEAGKIGRVAGLRARTAHAGPDVYYREIAKIFHEPEPEELWFFDEAEGTVGALFDMGVYAVAQVVALGGSVAEVAAMTTTFEKPTKLEDTATLVMKTRSGAMATAETSWCDGARTWEVSVHGTAGKLVMADRMERVLQYTPQAYDSDRAQITCEPIDTGRGVGNLHEHFLDCVERGVNPPLSNAHAARHVTEVLLAGLEAARSGGVVKIKSNAD